MLRILVDTFSNPLNTFGFNLCKSLPPFFNASFVLFLFSSPLLCIILLLPYPVSSRPVPPGFKLLLEVFSVIHGPQEECVRALRNGHLLGISPGGVREALFSDETYPLLWGKRKGFAQVAIDSQVVRCLL